MTGCASLQEYTESARSSGGQISVYLKIPDKTSTDITFDLQAVNIVSEDGTAREIKSSPQKINSISLAGRQMLLGEKALPEGRYKKIQFFIKQAYVRRDNKVASLALPPEGIETGIDITIKRNQSTSIFLTWNADGSIKEGYLFNPIFTVQSQVPELSNLLIYVTNEDSNNVSVINRQTGDIVATVLVGNRPRGIVTNFGREHPRVYVANSGSNSISVIDPTINKVDVEIPIRFGREPEGIIVNRPSPDRELIFVTNYGSDNVSVVDASTYQEIDKINVGDGPIAVSADPPTDTIPQSRFLKFDDINALRSYREKLFNVYVANKNSKDVSVIQMNISSNRPDDFFSVPVEWSPITLIVDPQRAKVYVGNYNYDNISVIDTALIAKGSKTGLVSEITNVGTSVTGIIADPDFDRIYVLKESSNEILIVKPFSEASPALKTTMAPIIGSIPVGNSPRSFILDPEGRKIYVVNRGADTVSVIDKTTGAEERVIPVGKRPYGIAMFPF